MHPQRVILTTRRKLRSPETGVNLHDPNIAPHNDKPHPPLLHSELHPLPNSPNPSIRMRLRSQCERGLNSLAHTKPRMFFNPIRLFSS